MTFNHVELGRAVTFMIYYTFVSLIFLSKTLIWNQIMLVVSNSLNFPELVVNELKKTNIHFYIWLSLLKVRLSPFKEFAFIYFNESPLKMMKTVFYFMLKALFVLEILTFWFFGFIEKRLDKKAMVNFKIYDVTDWTINNYCTHIAQYLMK